MRDIEIVEKIVQINAKGKDAYWSRDCIGFFGLSAVIRIPEQHFALTRVKHAAFIRIASFWARKLDRIWMNLAHIGQTWRVTWGLHTLEVDIIALGTIARTRKKFMFISYPNSVNFRTLLEFLTVFIQHILAPSR